MLFGSKAASESCSWQIQKLGPVGKDLSGVHILQVLGIVKQHWRSSDAHYFVSRGHLINVVNLVH